MSSKTSAIPAGYSDIPAGHIASVVTCLEMCKKPDIAPRALPKGFTLERYSGGSLDQYRALFRKVGADWLWFSRLLMSDEKLAAVLSKATLEIYVIRHQGEDVGLMELDFGVPDEAELVYLGLVSGTTGQGIGRVVMNAATELAWSRPIGRFWVHTCSFDHPSALSFYCRSGFVPFAFQVEVQPDPRLSGALPLTAASHVPIIRP
ncbi:hypothetical protein EDF81_2924 [Enterobacter sp. BIGb0383]|uniref:GNAT family N-acetyltransferase n=1 Tax=unclassified Enterobacter TaxID=2608935 RepID=UPI000F469A58|nr:MULTISPECIES: GNAT family N-acetyltransferase [unclassified Enterobacter]ROP60095.1 hypothetical protein EDF81_2924 [Enterobacter sp. BIGb0383]ROS08438.1 hypothetical protein EC848_1911 [Enterobacter sp. BIGb0359]